MSEGFQADARQIRRHAAGVEEVRARFGAVRAASAHIARDDAAYGLMCGWIAGLLEDRHQRQDALISYVEENLSLAADALTGVAGDYERADGSAAEAIRRAGPPR
jgi:hypothetical protein